jgi:FixJ family two-component response regulator
MTSVTTRTPCVSSQISGIAKTVPADNLSDAPTVVVVDDDPYILVALESLFRSCGLQVLTCSSAPELLDLPILLVGPGCLVLDVRLPGMSGLDLYARLASQGVCQDLLDSVNEGIERDHRRLEELRNLEVHCKNHASLTPREREIMRMVVTGLMNKQIAGELGLSEITVKIHRANLMRKMRLRTLADLVRIAGSLYSYSPDVLT